MSKIKETQIMIDNYLYDTVIPKGEPRRIECGITDDYSMFKDYFGNRDKNLKRAMLISSDMKKYGNFSSVCCIKDGDFLRVWDGQHVLEAAKKAGKHVNYDVYNSVPEDIMILKNKYTKQWTLKNFHKHGLDWNLSETLKVDAFMRKSKKVLGRTIELTASLRLLGNKYSNQNYKNKEFKIAKNNKAELILSYLKDYTEYIDFSASSKFVTSLFTINNTGLYQHEIMLKQLPKASRKLHNQLRVQDIVLGIQECYNHGRHTKVDFMLACGFRNAR